MSQNNSIKVFIKGMHCRSCELLIEENLKAVPYVESADIDYRTGAAVIHYGSISPNMHNINKAIAQAGYEVGQPDKLPLLTRDKKEYASLGIAFLFLMALFLVLKSLGLTNINFNPDLSSPSWGLIVIIGLVAGFSTCMALVGGLSLGLSAKFADNHPTATPAEKFRPHIFFVLGRILSYTLLGGLLGALGTVIQFSAAANGIMTLLVGAVMLVMGLQLINIFPRLSSFKFTLPKSIGKAFGLSHKSKEYSHGNAIMMGATTFFLPCGFTQAMQLYAISTGDFVFGAMVMGLFAIGTAPGLLSVGGLTSIIRGSFKEKFFKVAGLAVIAFALFNFNNGITLASLSIGDFGGADSQSGVVNDPNVVMENGVQVVRMTESGSGYSPNKFAIKKGVPVKWIIDAKAPYSCASSLVMSKLGIQKSLVAGENIIEFTPTETGRLPFSCSMGMYTGVFNVYDGNDAASAATAVNAPAPKSSGSCNMGGGGGCGGGCMGGGNKTVTPVVASAAVADSAANVQVIKTTYTSGKDISPNTFTVKKGVPVRFEIDVRDNGSGCMSTIMVQDLFENPQYLEAGKTLVMEFTPTKAGSYLITCAMNVPRGTIKVE